MQKLNPFLKLILPNSKRVGVLLPIITPIPSHYRPLERRALCCSPRNTPSLCASSSLSKNATGTFLSAAHRANRTPKPGGPLTNNRDPKRSRARRKLFSSSSSLACGSTRIRRLCSLPSAQRKVPCRVVFCGVGRASSLARPKISPWTVPQSFRASRQASAPALPFPASARSHASQGRYASAEARTSTGKESGHGTRITTG